MERNVSAGKVIWGSFLALLALFVSEILADQAVNLLLRPGLNTGVCEIIGGILYLALGFILVKLLIQRVFRSDPGDFGMSKPGLSVKWIAAAVLLPAAVVCVYLFIFKGDFVSSEMTGNQVFITFCAGIFFIGIGGGFVEEFVMRGVVMNLFRKRWNTAVAVIVPSLLFALLPAFGSSFSVGKVLLMIASGTMSRIMFSLIAVESGSVWNSAIVHAIWNIVITGNILAIAGGPNSEAVETYVLNNASFALTGEVFGIGSAGIALIGYICVSLIALILIVKKPAAKASAEEL